MANIMVITAGVPALLCCGCGERVETSLEECEAAVSSPYEVLCESCTEDMIVPSTQESLRDLVIPEYSLEISEGPVPLMELVDSERELMASLAKYGIFELEMDVCDLEPPTRRMPREYHDAIMATEGQTSIGVSVRLG